MISIISCQKQDKYVITGNVTGFPDSTIVYLQNLSTEEKFDSALIIGGKFQLIGHLQDEPEQIWLTSNVGNKFIFTNLLIGNEKVKITGDIKDFPFNVKITGSPSQDDLNHLRDLTKMFDIKRDSLVKSFFELSPNEQEEKGKEIVSAINKLDDTTHAIRVQYVKSHINTYPGIIYLGYLKNSLPKDTVRALYNKLSNEIRSSKYAKVIEIYLKDKIPEIGDTYYDFKAIDRNNDTIVFSSLVGKYILLDFTSAYCGPCVKSAAELRLINRTYSDSLEIVSFSGDANKVIWLKSLKRDSVSWISLWDGKGTYSETYIKYGVQGLPTFFLIDPNGIIIDKWSGYGEGLLKKKLSRFKNN